MGNIDKRHQQAKVRQTNQLYVDKLLKADRKKNNKEDNSSHEEIRIDDQSDIR